MSEILSKPFALTKRELDVMEIMWNFNRSIRRKDFIDVANERGFNVSNLNLLLNKLLHKEIIKVDEIVKTGKTFGRTYSPKITREEYYAMQLKSNPKGVDADSITKVLAALVDNAEGGEKTKQQTIKSIVAALVDDDEFNNDTIKKLLEIIDES
jgi:predicted transcriptional regulator